jgi:hypothetical protein
VVRGPETSPSRDCTRTDGSDRAPETEPSGTALEMGGPLEIPPSRIVADRGGWFAGD